MNKTQEEKLKVLAGELAKDIKTGEDLSSLSPRLVKLTVEAALGAEMESHLGYPPHSTAGHHTGNSRNGTSAKILKGDHGEIRIETPRDRLKVIFLATQSASKKCTMPIKNWKAAMNRFAIEFAEQIAPYM